MKKMIFCTTIILLLSSYAHSATVTFTEDFKDIREWKQVKNNISSADYAVDSAPYGGMVVNDIQLTNTSQDGYYSLQYITPFVIAGDFSITFNITTDFSAPAKSAVWLGLQNYNTPTDYIHTGITDGITYADGGHIGTNIHDDVTDYTRNETLVEGPVTITAQRVGNSMTVLVTAGSVSHQVTTDYFNDFNYINIIMKKYADTPFSTQYLNSLSLTYEVDDMLLVPEPASILLLLAACTHFIIRKK